MEILREESPYYGKAVRRNGNVVIKQSKPWTATVHSFLRHLRACGFSAAPTVVGTGLDTEGNETLSYVEGDIADQLPMTELAALETGKMLRQLHDTAATYEPPISAVWRPWYGRQIGGSPKIVSHCDVAPWNIVSRHGVPFAFIDWDYSGPVDPQVDLAQACWLNAKLHDEVVADHEGLPSVSERAKLLLAIVDGYRLPKRQRLTLVDRMIEFAIHSAASEADEAHILPDSDCMQVDKKVLWALAWRSRAAAWMLRNRSVLERALR